MNRPAVRARTYGDGNVDCSEEVIQGVGGRVALAVWTPGRLCDLLEIATEALETFHLVQATSRVSHGEILIVVPVIRTNK